MVFRKKWINFTIDTSNSTIKKTIKEYMVEIET